MSHRIIIEKKMLEKKFKETSPSQSFPEHISRRRFLKDPKTFELVVTPKKIHRQFIKKQEAIYWKTALFQSKKEYQKLKKAFHFAKKTQKIILIPGRFSSALKKAS